jgi:hypothetical protein
MINSLDTKSRMAEKLSIPQLQAAIQNGTIPSFIGIPLLNEKVTNAQKAKMASQRTQQQQQGPQPTIADQVMQQAQATAGIPTLPTNLSDEESYANGGIVAFARGGSSMSDMASQYLSDEDDDEMDYVRAILAGIGEDEYQEEEESSEEGMGEEEMAGMSAPSISMPMIAQYMRESTTAKEEGAPAQTVGREKEAVYAPAGGISPEMISNIRTEKPSTGVDDSLLKHVLHKESRGRRYDKDGNLLTSPKGAQGEMQVMPGTQRDPGFGVAPARDNSPDEMARVGRDYLDAMMKRYKDPKLAAVAYNWGPGNTDKWLMAGADPSKLPSETRNYIQGLAGGGIVGLAGGALVPFSYPAVSALDPYDYVTRNNSPAKVGSKAYDVSDEAKKIREEAARRLRMEQARAAFGANPAAAPTAPVPAAPAATSYMDKLKALAGRAGAAASRFSPASLGLMALTPGTLNSNEKEELERRRAMPPTITTTEKLRPMTPPGSTTGRRPDDAPMPGPGRPPEGPPKAGDTASQQEETLINFPSGVMDVSPESIDEIVKEEAKPEEKKEVQKEEGVKELSGLQKLLAERSAASKQQREIDNYMALLSAGLGMMGGTSPYASANIGQGAQQGIATFQRSAAQRAQEERDILSGQLAMEKYGPLREIQKEQLAAKERYNTAMLEARGLKDKEAIRQRGERLTQASRNSDIELLKQMLDLNEKRVIAESKTAFTDASKEQIKAQAQIDLLNRPEYREVYKRVYGFDPGGKGGILSYDPKTKSLR